MRSARPRAPPRELRPTSPKASDAVEQPAPPSAPSARDSKSAKIKDRPKPDDSDLAALLADLIKTQRRLQQGLTRLDKLVDGGI